MKKGWVGKFARVFIRNRRGLGEKGGTIRGRVVDVSRNFCQFEDYKEDEKHEK